MEQCEFRHAKNLRYNIYEGWIKVEGFVEFSWGCWESFFNALKVWRFFNCFILRYCDLVGVIDDELLSDWSILFGNEEDEDGEEDEDDLNFLFGREDDNNAEEDDEDDEDWR